MKSKKFVEVLEKEKLTAYIKKCFGISALASFLGCEHLINIPVDVSPFC